jgi:Zn-dependent M28 family amino/carboxypeptidase
LQTAIDKDLSNHSMALADSSVTFHVENKSRISGVTHNVAGLLPGSDPALGAETVMITAHHDHDGASPGADGVLEIWHGADDNGSGTVGVVELAHAFAANRAKPKRSILFVVFAAEERGLLGSYYMAAHPLRPLATTRAMINFDMIGRDEAPSEQTEGLIEIPANTTNRLNLIGAAYSPQFKNTVAQANRAIGLDLDDRFDHENALNVFFRSDQFPFLLHDIPAFWFFTGFHPDYHHVTDTPDKIDYHKMLKILQLSYLSAWSFANSAGYPAFVADPPGT